MAAELPTGARGRLFAVGLTVMVAAAAWLGIAQPLLEWHAERAERVERQVALARRVAALTTTLPALRAAAAAAVEAGPEAARLLEGGSDAVAGAALQARVQDIAARAGSTLASAESLPAEQLGAYRRISLRVNVSVPWPALVEMLRTLEATSPRMLVDDLQMQPAPSMQVTGRPLGVTLTVLAYRAAEAPPASR